jgi:hypothetical protein
MWTFTTAPCFVIEDFCSPWRGVDDPWMLWEGHGAAAGHVSYMCRCGDGVYQEHAEIPRLCEPAPDISPICRLYHETIDKALELEYFNFAQKYSETGHVVCPGDWLGVRATAVSLGFKGDATNVPDRLYVRVEDADGSAAEVEYDGPADLTTTQWQRWAAQLDELGGIVDLTRVKKLYVGVGDRAGSASMASGRLYIDDIRLCVPHCLPESARPAKDHNDDCVVNFPDHAQDLAVTGGSMASYADFAAVWLENTLWP